MFVYDYYGLFLFVPCIRRMGYNYIPFCAFENGTLHFDKNDGLVYSFVGSGGTAKCAANSLYFFCKYGKDDRIEVFRDAGLVFPGCTGTHQKALSFNSALFVVPIWAVLEGP